VGSTVISGERMGNKKTALIQRRPGRGEDTIVLYARVGRKFQDWDQVRKEEQEGDGGGSEGSCEGGGGGSLRWPQGKFCDHIRPEAEGGRKKSRSSEIERTYLHWGSDYNLKAEAEKSRAGAAMGLDLESVRRRSRWDSKNEGAGWGHDAGYGGHERIKAHKKRRAIQEGRTFSRPMRQKTGTRL